MNMALLGRGILNTWIMDFYYGIYNVWNNNLFRFYIVNQGINNYTALYINLIPSVLAFLALLHLMN